MWRRSSSIISVDATLTYGLLKIANSVYFALRSRVTSVRQAIMTVGLERAQAVGLPAQRQQRGEPGVDEGAEEFLQLVLHAGQLLPASLMNYAKDMPISKSGGLPDGHVLHAELPD